MLADTTIEARPPVRPMGDDWLTRDPESFDDGPAGATFDTGVAMPTRWQRLRDDLALYVAGITTGLAVVVAVLLLMTLLQTPSVAVAPPMTDTAPAEAHGTFASR